MDNERPPRWSVLLLAVAVEGSLAVLAWAIGWLAGTSPWEHFAYDPVDMARGIIAAVPLLLVFALCLRLSWPPLVRIRRLCVEIIRPFFASNTVLDLAIISVVAGIAEEMLFRGVLQTVLIEWVGPWPGVAAASLVFGLAHLLTATYAVIVTLAGAYLGTIYLMTGNLMVAIMAHAVYDFIALWYLVHGPRLKV
jgi:membrane protease YdiL (CAAX protease family)